MNQLCKGLPSSHHADQVRKEIQAITDRELELIGTALDQDNLSDNDRAVLWVRWDELRAIQAITDGKYTTNDPTMAESKIFTLID